MPFLRKALSIRLHLLIGCLFSTFGCSIWAQVPPIVIQVPRLDAPAELPKLNTQPQLRIGPGLPSLPPPPDPNCRTEVTEVTISPDDPKGAEEKAWELLDAREGLNPENYRDLLAGRLIRAGKLRRCDIQRVEITGIIATHETDTRFDELFDLRLHPSYLSDSEIESMFEAQHPLLGRLFFPFRWGRLLGKILKDIDALAMDIYGHPTDRGRKVLAPIVDKDVCELVTHSWGTELAFNAILDGVIRPPARILVFAPPHQNMLKWAVLARHLDTEVRVFLSVENLRRKPDIPAAIAKGITIGGYYLNIFPGQVPDYSADEWEEKWRTFCSAPDNIKFCRPQGPGRFQAERVPILQDGGPSGHDRFAYYGYGRKQRFLLKSASQMAAEQEQRITEEVAEALAPLYRQALEEAHEELARPQLVRKTRQICGRQRDPVPQMAPAREPATAVIPAARPQPVPEVPPVESAPLSSPSVTCTLATPKGYRGMGGQGEFRYKSREDCEGVNRSYFSGQGTCQCY